MSEKTDEMIDELKYCAGDYFYACEWGEGTAQAAREVSDAKAALRAEIAAMEKVCEAAIEWDKLPHFNTVLKLRAAVKEYQERTP